MKSLYLPDLRLTLHLRDEAPPLPVGSASTTTRSAPPTSSDSGAVPARTKDDFRKAWRRAAEHYGVTLNWQGEDEAILNRLLTKYGKEELGNRAREFWLREAGPLIEGEYHRSMVLFASKIEGLD